MKKMVFILALTFMANYLYSQDYIKLNDGSEIKCKIVSINNDVVKYRAYLRNISIGPLYAEDYISLNRDLIKTIQYENNSWIKEDIVDVQNKDVDVSTSTALINNYLNEEISKKEEEYAIEDDTETLIGKMLFGDDYVSDDANKQALYDEIYQQIEIDDLANDTTYYDEFEEGYTEMTVVHDNSFYDDISDKEWEIYDKALDSLEANNVVSAAKDLISLFDYNEEPTHIGLLANDVLADIYASQQDLYNLGVCARYTRSYMANHLWDSEVSNNYSKVLSYIGDIKNNLPFTEDLTGIWVSDFSIGGEYIPYLMIEINNNGGNYQGRILPGCYVANKYSISSNTNYLLSYTNGFTVDMDALQSHLFFGDSKYRGSSGILAKAATDFTKEVSETLITSINLNVNDVWERQLQASGVELGAAALSALFAMASVTKETDRTIDLVMTESYDGAMVAVIIESIIENWSDGRHKENHYPYNFMMYKLYPDFDGAFIGYDNQSIGFRKSSVNDKYQNKRINKAENNKKTYNGLCENTCYSYIHYCEKLDNNTERAIRYRFEAANKGSLYGEKTYNDGSQYMGMMYADTKMEHGKGKIIFKDNGIYEGCFVNGEMNGRGKYTYPNGRDYIIQNYENNKRNGVYIEYTGDTIKIESYFEMDKLVGITTISYANGDSIFINHDYNGTMKPIEKRKTNGDYFIGFTDVKGKKMNGVWYEIDGTTIENKYKDGEKHGLSTTNKPDGTIIKEHWKNGKKDGKTKIKNPDGSVSVEYWKDGTKIERQ